LYLNFSIIFVKKHLKMLVSLITIMDKELCLSVKIIQEIEEAKARIRTGKFLTEEEAKIKLRIS